VAIAMVTVIVKGDSGDSYTNMLISSIIVVFCWMGNNLIKKSMNVKGSDWQNSVVFIFCQQVISKLWILPILGCIIILLQKGRKMIDKITLCYSLVWNKTSDNDLWLFNVWIMTVVRFPITKYVRSIWAFEKLIMI